MTTRHPGKVRGGMERRERIRRRLLVEPGTPAGLAGRDPAWTGGKEFEQLSAEKLKKTAKAVLKQGVKELADAQELLWASDRYAADPKENPTPPVDLAATVYHLLGVDPRMEIHDRLGRPMTLCDGQVIEGILS